MPIFIIISFSLHMFGKKKQIKKFARRASHDFMPIKIPRS